MKQVLLASSPLSARWSFPLLAAIALHALACASTVPEGTFVPPESFGTDRFASPEVLAKLEAPEDMLYLLGEGDRVTIDVFTRPGLTALHVIGPDGRVTVPVAGPVQIAGLSRSEAAQRVTQALSRYFIEPGVTLRVEEYVANRILLLGRVGNPGIVRFEGQPTLLEALARAGALPVLDKQATLTRCAIFRGRNRIIWVDLKRLLNSGHLEYNVRLLPNDLVYIPDSDDTLVYVLGQVGRPGAYRLTPDMTFLDALAQAGGITEDGDEDGIRLVRRSKHAELEIDFDKVLEGGKGSTVVLEEGDIIYVPKSGLAKAGYIMQKLSPATSFLIFGEALGFGAP